jgi:hypothetical protein
MVVSFCLTTARTSGNPDSSVSSSRIDRIYTTPEVSAKTVKWEITPVSGFDTDHDMVSMTWYPRDRVKLGPGCWVMNAKLFGNQKFIDIAKVTIKELDEKVAPHWLKVTENDWTTYSPRSDVAAKEALYEYSHFEKTLVTRCKALQKTLANDRFKKREKLPTGIVERILVRVRCGTWAGRIEN